MATEQVLQVPIRRYTIESERPFANVLDGIFGGISRPDTGALFSDLEASSSYEQFSSLVQQAQGSAGLMRFWQLDLDVALTLDPQARDQAGRRLVRLIAGNPVTMGEMTRHVADAGSYAPVTILIHELPDGGTRVAYDSVASAIAPYHDAAALEVAQRLDTEVLTLLREATGVPGIREHLSHGAAIHHSICPSTSSGLFRGLRGARRGRVRAGGPARTRRPCGPRSVGGAEVS